MSDRNGSIPKLELKLNLSPPRVVSHRPESPTLSTTMSPASPPPSLCVSVEVSQEEEDNNNNNLEHPNNPEAISLVLVGCPRCHMYVMVAEDNLRCLKCGSTTLLEFDHDNNNNNLIIRK
ncbi:uncharacterized protein LOC109815885 [Cajanus cajan]|uniref:GIR1-like zinc ribbon domain-containing protein n=1 Tax=Cajanus cajan TaxID=3821 RepID=A0A151RTX3_CAJCA|nr:uncharacterized protein LOC109815885 [Cajanus cajan]KYP45998.1 hypothetical protein KK1_032444 [Cajanus cajan]